MLTNRLTGGGIRGDRDNFFILVIFFGIASLIGVQAFILPKNNEEQDLVFSDQKNLWSTKILGTKKCLLSKKIWNQENVFLGLNAEFFYSPFL